MKRVASDLLYFFDCWLVSLIAGEYGLDEKTALLKFLGSETYKMLLDEELKLFRESPLFIFDMYQKEVETGDPRNSSYIRWYLYV